MNKFKIEVYLSLNTLTGEEFSETEPFMHLSNHGVNNFWNTFNVDSKNERKLQQIVFGFLDMCIWIGSKVLRKTNKCIMLINQVLSTTLLV